MLTSVADDAPKWHETAVVESAAHHLEIAVRWPETNDAFLRLAGEHGATLDLAPTANPPTARWTPSPDAPAPSQPPPVQWHEPTAATDTPFHVLTVKRRPRGVFLYRDGVPFARFPEPFPGQTLELSLTDAARPDHDDAPTPFHQRIGDLAFRDDFMVPPDAEFPLAAWDILCGEWNLHVVERDPTRPVARGRANRVPTAERSPNFYSLQGMGTPALIAAGSEFDDHYILRAAIEHADGINGIVFMLGEDGAFHALTAETDPLDHRVTFVLWAGTTNLAERTVLAAAHTALFPGQWYRLEAQVFDDRIRAVVDDIEILRERVILPPGGRFGLFTDHPDGARFDDVEVLRHEDIPLENESDLPQHLETVSGTFQTHRTPLPLHPEATPPSFHLEVTGKTPVELRVGANGGIPRRIEADFHLPTRPSTPVAIGFGTASAPHAPWVFSVMPTATGTVATLSGPTGESGPDTYTVVLPQDNARETLRLQLDATEGPAIRAFLNDEPVATLFAESPPTGVVRMQAPPGTRFTMPRVQSVMRRYRDDTESNPQYVTDPYMRHWASPEGQWVPFPDGLTWFRGDAFGQVSVTLPAIDPSELHLAVPHGATNGHCRLIITNQTLFVHAGPENDTPLITIPLKSLPQGPPRDGLDDTIPIVTLDLHARHLWLSSNGRLLQQARLKDRPDGSRLRIAGLDLTALRHVQVRRDGVLDILFKDSPHEWILQGGRWEVINRFDCEPTWSHMTGENRDGLAAIWAKTQLSGDFCAEAFVGIRHGFYERVGDMNLTLLGERATPGDGYSVISTGWDPHHSQQFSRLFRNGKLMQVSTNYVAPRHREGNVRRGYEPLLASGRDVHGAWYSLKLRRIGNRLLFTFDNQDVFDIEDPDPLPSGGMGLWTFRNSMVVSRIRVAASQVSPRPFVFSRLSAKELAARQATASALAEATPPTPRDPRHVVTLDMDAWQLPPCPAAAELSWQILGDEPVLMVRGRHAGGNLHANPLLPPIPTDTIAGWRFEIARTPETRVNALFEMGVDAPDGTFNASWSGSLILSGTDNADGPRRMYPGPSIPASPDAQFPKNATWTPVTLWFPLDGITATRHARFAGLGNLQPSDTQQGLDGNPPGSAYAIRRLEPIWYGTTPTEGPLARIGEVAPAPRPEDWRFSLCEFHPDTILLRNQGERPPRIGANGTVTVNGEPTRLVAAEDHWRAHLPRPFPLSDDGKLHVRLTHEADPEPIERVIDLAKNPSPFSPILLSLESPGRFESFESHTPESLVRFRAAAVPVLQRPAPNHPAVLHVSNAGNAARLHFILANGVDLTANPLLHVRYRASEFSRVSLEIPGLATLPFSEAAVARPAAILDGQWHRLDTQLHHGLQTYPLQRARMLANAAIHFRSTHRFDQTGRYAWMDIEHYALGPAVGPLRPLTLTPRFTSLHPIQRIAYALRTSADSPEKVSWTEVENGQPFTPKTNGLADGLYWLCLQAWDVLDRHSEITEFPFLLDTRADPAQARFEATPEQGPKSRLALSIDTAGGSPINLAALELLCDNQPVTLVPESIQAAYSPNQVRVMFDWPILLRRILNQSENDQTLAIRIQGLADGAGNPVEPVETSIHVDYEQDQTPPTLTAIETDRSPLFWNTFLSPEIGGFTLTQHVTIQSQTPTNDPAFLHVTTGRSGAHVGQRFPQQGWGPETHPWLALSLSAPAPKGNHAPVTLTFVAVQAVFPQGKTKTQTFSIPLDPDNPKIRAVTRGEIRWADDHWNDLVIDARALLQEAAGTRRAPQIRDVRLDFPPVPQFTVHVRTAAVLTDWNAEHRISFRAYDASGIRGLQWQNGQLDAATVRPYRFSLPAEDSDWMRIRVVDRAGNTTRPFLVPVPPDERTPEDRNENENANNEDPEE